MCDDTDRCILSHCSAETMCTMRLVGTNWKRLATERLVQQYEEELCAYMRAMCINDTMAPSRWKVKAVLTATTSDVRVASVNYKCGRCGRVCRQLGVRCAECQRNEMRTSTPPFPWMRVASGPILLCAAATGLFCIRLYARRTL